jgi:hypothetical protein
MVHVVHQLDPETNFGARYPCKPPFFFSTNRRINICRMFIQVLYSDKICGKYYNRRKIRVPQNSRQKQSQAFPSVNVYHFGTFSSVVIYICLCYVINARKMIIIHVNTICCCEIRKKKEGGNFTILLQHFHLLK